MYPLVKQTLPCGRAIGRCFFFVGELLRHLTIVLFCLEKMCLLKYFQPIIWQGRRVNCGECISITNCIEYCVFVGMEFWDIMYMYCCVRSCNHMIYIIYTPWSPLFRNMLQQSLQDPISSPHAWRRWIKLAKARGDTATARNSRQRMIQCIGCLRSESGADPWWPCCVATSTRPYLKPGIVQIRFD